MAIRLRNLNIDNMKEINITLYSDNFQRNGQVCVYQVQQVLSQQKLLRRFCTLSRFFNKYNKIDKKLKIYI